MYQLHKTFCTCCSQIIIVDNPFVEGFITGTEVADVSVTYTSISATNIQNECGYYTEVCQSSGGQFNINNTFLLQSCYDNVGPAGENSCSYQDGHHYLKIVGSCAEDSFDISEVYLNYQFGFLTGGNKFEPGGCGAYCYSEYESNPWTDAMSITIPCNSGYTIHPANIGVTTDSDENVLYGYNPILTGSNEIEHVNNLRECCIPSCIELADGNRYPILCSGPWLNRNPCHLDSCICNPPYGDIGTGGIAFTKLCEEGDGRRSCILIIPKYEMLESGEIIPLLGGTVQDFVNAINSELNGQNIIAASLTLEPYWIGGKSRGSSDNICSCFSLGQADQFRFKLDENGNPIIIQQSDNTYKYIIEARYSTYFSLMGVEAGAQKGCYPKEIPCQGVFDPDTGDLLSVPDGCCCTEISENNWSCLNHQTCASTGNPITIAGGFNDFTCFPACLFISDNNIVIPSECISDNIPKNDPDNPELGCCVLDPYDFSDPDPNNWVFNLCGNQLGILVWEKYGKGIRGEFGPIITTLDDCQIIIS